MTVLFSVHGGLYGREPAGGSPASIESHGGGEEGRGGEEEEKRSSNTFSLLSEHDIVRIRGEKWAPRSARG